MNLCGVKLNMSTSRHPKTDRALDMMNRMIEKYLRYFCSYNQDDWDELRPATEFAYNSAMTEDLGLCPFEIDIDWIPKFLLDMLSGFEISVKSVEKFKEKLKASLEDVLFSCKIKGGGKNLEKSHTLQR